MFDDAFDTANMFALRFFVLYSSAEIVCALPESDVLARGVELEHWKAGRGRHGETGEPTIRHRRARLAFRHYP